MIVTSLTPLELDMSRVVAVERNAGAAGMPQSNPGANKDALESHYVGVCAEMAFCKALNVYYEPTAGTYKTKPDCQGFEVRGTTYTNGVLIIGDRDRGILSRPFALVIGDPTRYPRFTVYGWCIGTIVSYNSDADGWRGWNPNVPADRSNSWGVPQQYLTQFTEADIAQQPLSDSVRNW